METIFSVYQLNVEFVRELMAKSLLVNDEQIGSHEELDNVIKFLLMKIMGKNTSQNSYYFCTNRSHIYLYKKRNAAKWAPMILNENARKIKGDDLQSSQLNNESLSYLMITPINRDIYISTGGYGSSLVKPFVNSKLGLHLITRLFEGDEPIIKQSRNEYLTGTTSSESSINRDYLSFQTEKDYAKFFSNISADTSSILMKKLGLIFEEDERIRIESSDSFKVNRNISYEEFYCMIESIDEIMKTEPKFSLSYFVPIRDIDVRNATVFNKMKDYIVEKPTIIKDILLTTHDHFQYQKCTNFIVEDGNGKRIMQQKVPFTFEDILNLAEKEKNKDLNKSMLEEVWSKWKLYAELDEYNITENLPIRDLLQFSFETTVKKEKYKDFDVVSNKQWFYLNSGEWYVLDLDYLQFIEEEYRIILEQNIDALDVMYMDKGLVSEKYQTESNYHDCLKKSLNCNKEFFITDKKLVNNIEICDVMTFDDDKIYLIGNKSKPIGSGCRDLFNQLESSMRLLENTSIEAVFGTIYDRLKSERIEEIFSSKGDFINYIKERKIVYVAVFTEEQIKKDTNSMYCKLLLLQLKKDMLKSGFDFYIYDPRIKDVTKLLM